MLELRYFSPDEIPSALLSGHGQRIRDAFSGACGLARSHITPSPFDQPLTRQELYAMRDQSGLCKAEFYTRHFALPGDEPLEITASRHSP